MPRPADPKKAYLELHGELWRVVVTVPAGARKVIGKTKLVAPLKTDSLRQANALKGPHVERFRRQIRLAIETAGKPSDSDMQVALGFAKAASAMRKSGAGDWEDFHAAVYERHAEIRQQGVRVSTVIDDEEGPIDVEWEDPNQTTKAELFSAIAHGRSTPIDVMHSEYRAQLHVQDRTRADDERAMSLLRRWCAEEGLAFVIETFDAKAAWAFADQLTTMTGNDHVTCKKYVSRLGGYWKYLVLRLDAAKSNPFAGVSVRGPSVSRKLKERPFTNREIATLLAGPATVQMIDLMKIGALAGARLDAIVDLSVGDCANRCFLFKPQKQEEYPRYVPMHPELWELIDRRSHGKKDDDDLFPEWPPVRKAGSMRERSFKASNHFTDYRRLAGVDARVPGKRRSLVNFHSFRRWFISRLEQLGVDGDLISAIVGHKRGSVTLDVYSEGPLMRSARRAIAKLTLPNAEKPIREPERISDRGRR